ncbi:MAG: universal stress protein [Nocardioides sp.]|uniref:universal stress protein n=1 Tax=Nocardioides sp. TaxID=35761 RepID=UPI003F01261C
MTTDVQITSGIVAGHDGSALASVAVQRAAELAVRLSVPLHVVRAWSLRTAPTPSTMTGGYVPPEEDFEAAVLKELAEHLAAIDLPEGLQLQTHAVRGQSAGTLIEVAGGAEMLVVGNRGKGGFRGLRLGSTADQVLQHAKVAVLVVPTSTD